MKKRFTDEQIIGLLKQADAGVPVKELCRQHGFSDASFYTWRVKFGGMTVRMRSDCLSWKRRMRSSRSC